MTTHEQLLRIHNPVENWLDFVVVDSHPLKEGNMLTATLEMEELTITFTAVRDRVDPDYIKDHEVEELRIFGVRVGFKSLPKELQQELEELAYEVDEWHEVDFG